MVGRVYQETRARLEETAQGFLEIGPLEIAGRSVSTIPENWPLTDPSSHFAGQRRSDHQRASEATAGGIPCELLIIYGVETIIVKGKFDRRIRDWLQGWNRAVFKGETKLQVLCGGRWKLLCI